MKIRNPLHVILDLIEPVCWRIIQMCFSSKLDSCSFGKCRFYGEMAYVTVFKEAMCELERIDFLIYSEITKSNMTLMKLPYEIQYQWRYNRRYSIDKWFSENGTDGYIFGIVTYCFQDNEVHGRGWVRSHLLKQEQCVLAGLTNAVDWLRVNGYNEESISILERLWYQRKGLAKAGEVKGKGAIQDS